MLNCLFSHVFLRIFRFPLPNKSPAKRVLFGTEEQRSGVERRMPSPAGCYTRSGLCDEVVGMGFCPIFGIWQDAGVRRLAKCDAGSSRMGRFFPPRRGLLCALNPRFSALPARRRNVGFFCRAAHTLAVWAEGRTQRRHAAHGAVRTLGTPAGSIVPIVFTGRKSALSARLREITVCRCCGRYPPESLFLLEPQRFPAPTA